MDADLLSPLGRQLLDAHPAAYEALVAPSHTPAQAIERLRNVKPAQLLARPAVDDAAAYAVLAGVWLWHDGLHECHEIVQKSPAELRSAAPQGDAGHHPEHRPDLTETLAFWHAIMHRREGDFSNAKYWYARCRTHPVLATLAEHLRTSGDAPAPDSSIVTGGTWNGDGFVDLVEAVSRRPDEPRREEAVRLQRLEWRMLFDYCVRAACGQVK